MGYVFEVSTNNGVKKLTNSYQEFSEACVDSSTLRGDPVQTHLTAPIVPVLYPLSRKRWLPTDAATEVIGSAGEAEGGEVHPAFKKYVT